MMSRAQIVESTHERILRVAAELFAVRGFHGTGMTELCEAAGIGRGAMYYQIGSKEQLLFDLCRRHVEEALASARRSLEGIEDAKAQFEAFVVQHMQILAERRAEVIVAERERHALTGELAQRLATIHREYRNLLVGILERGREQGHFTRAEYVDAMGALGMISYTYMWLDPHGRTPVDEIARRFSDTLIGGLGVALPPKSTPLPVA